MIKSPTKLMKSFYITTPIYYVNDRPHIGHSYCTIAADAHARYHRLRGEAVLLSTGTDEHGQKVALSAEAQGMAPQEFVDEVVSSFKQVWQRLHINYDRFIRTSAPRHIATVHSDTSSGGTSTAASPTTSGRAETLEQITGSPQDIASSGGRPKPS